MGNTAMDSARNIPFNAMIVDAIKAASNNQKVSIESYAETIKKIVRKCLCKDYEQANSINR